MKFVFKKDAKAALVSIHCRCYHKIIIDHFVGPLQWLSLISIVLYASYHRSIVCIVCMLQTAWQQKILSGCHWGTDVLGKTLRSDWNQSFRK